MKKYVYMIAGILSINIEAANDLKLTYFYGMLCDSITQCEVSEFGLTASFNNGVITLSGNASNYNISFDTAYNVQISDLTCNNITLNSGSLDILSDRFFNCLNKITLEDVTFSNYGCWYANSIEISYRDTKSHRNRNLGYIGVGNEYRNKGQVEFGVTYNEHLESISECGSIFNYGAIDCGSIDMTNFGIQNINNGKINATDNITLDKDSIIKTQKNQTTTKRWNCSTDDYSITYDERSSCYKAAKTALVPLPAGQNPIYLKPYNIFDPFINGATYSLSQSIKEIYRGDYTSARFSIQRQCVDESGNILLRPHSYFKDLIAKANNSKFTWSSGEIGVNIKYDVYTSNGSERHNILQTGNISIHNGKDDKGVEYYGAWSPNNLSIMNENEAKNNRLFFIQTKTRGINQLDVVLWDPEKEFTGSLNNIKSKILSTDTKYIKLLRDVLNCCVKEENASLWK